MWLLVNAERNSDFLLCIALLPPPSEIKAIL